MKTETPTHTSPEAADQAIATRSRPSRPTVDEMSEWSFPASDPPASWTWDVPDPAPAADGPRAS